MDLESADQSSKQPTKDSDAEPPSVSMDNNSSNDSNYVVSTSDTTSLAKSTIPVQPVMPAKETSDTGNAGKMTFARLASGIGFNFAQKVSGPNENAKDTSSLAQSGVFESLTKGLVDSSLNAVKAVQVKARHMVSQNKRRYQEGGFDLDMTYITENIIAMGFPAGDLSSGFFGYVEGLYRNHMEEVIKFFETHHKDKYKVYNLCSERLYDASLFEGKVASFPFDDHNCPPIHLIPLFCQSAYSWLKEDILNVVVVHCKAGKARTGLMICTLLLFLKFFPTAEECIEYYNQKRCVDGKGLILPSQIRYVKYYERILTNFNGKNPPGRRCMLRGFRLHKCPSWLRPSITISNHNGVLFSTRKHPKTKDLMPEDFWIRAPRKGIVVFALPGEPGLTELTGDFKIHFHDRQGDFYCWLNTTMMENRLILNTADLDDFDSRKFPTPGFQVEIVMVDFDGTIPAKYQTNNTSKGPDGRLNSDPSSTNEIASNSNQTKVSGNSDNDNVFSDSDEEEPKSSRTSLSQTASRTAPAESDSMSEQIKSIQNGTEHLSFGSTKTSVEKSTLIPNLDSGDIKAIAADASVFTFGDEDFESD